VNLISVWHYNLNGDAPSAVAFLRRAYPHHPDDFQINHNIAFFHIRNNRCAEALAHSLAAIAVRPRSSAAWLDYAEAMAELGQHGEAAAGYRRVAELAPRTWSYRIMAATVLERLGRKEEAAAEYRKALTTALEHPDLLLFEPVLTTAVGGWKQHGLFDRFKTGVLQAGRLGQQSTTAYLGLVRALRSVGEFDAAVIVLREAIRHHPNDPPTRRLLGGRLREQGDLDGAVEQLEAAVRLDPKDTVAANTLRAVRQAQADRTAPPPRVKR
jgi:Flp pilus assembly protein TadD